MIDVYGIKNCDTMKKALRWLDDHGVDYIFHDYKKEDASETVLQNAIAAHGWDSVINKRGTTWRRLPDDVKNAVNDQSAITLAIENPSIIKRPLITAGDDVYLGFDEGVYEESFL